VSEEKGRFALQVGRSALCKEAGQPAIWHKRTMIVKNRF